ncbi:MAG: hypothetical protein GY694_10860 [Gammaproteobacteria bacterium]|nr:hypothetical protein [Gammaproteobacteria bacterium]
MMVVIGSMTVSMQVNNKGVGMGSSEHDFGDDERIISFTSAWSTETNDSKLLPEKGSKVGGAHGVLSSALRIFDTFSWKNSENLSVRSDRHVEVGR